MKERLVAGASVPVTEMTVEEVIERASRRRPSILLYDIDGFVCDSRVRLARHVDLSLEGDDLLQCWWRYSQTIEGDTIIPEGVAIAHALYHGIRPDLLGWITARSSSGRHLTEKWLREHVRLPIDHLWMGNPLDFQPDGRIDYPGRPRFRADDHKREVVKEIRSVLGYDIVAAVEDHPRTAEMYHEEGILVLHFRHPGVDCLTPAGDPKK